MHKKQMISALLAAATALSVFSGCKGPSGTAAGDTQNSNSSSGEKQEITVEAMDNGTCAASEGTVESNRWTKWINEKCGVKVTFISVPRTKATDKIKAMFAADTAPDVVWDYGQQGALQKEGVLMPLDDLINEKSTAYKEYINKPENADLLPYTKESDGKTYYMTSRRPITTLAVHGMYIRQDWLDKLKLKMPTTDQEVLDVARAFVKQDPDGNGKADTVGIAFGSAFNSLSFSNFVRGIYGGGADYFEDGKYYINDTSMFSSPRYKDAWQFRKTCFDEGLIDKEYVTDTTFSREEQLFTTGKAGMYFGSWDISKNYRKLLANVPDADIEPIPLLTTKYGKYALFQNTPPNMFVAINKKCKNPEAAMKYLDWIISDGWFTLKYGNEGEHYKMVNDVPQTIDADKNDKEIGYSGLYALLTQDKIKLDTFPIRFASDSVSQNWAKIAVKQLEIIFSQPYKRLSPDDHANIDDTTNLLTFSSAKKKIDAKVIMGGDSNSVDWGIDQMLSESKRQGGDTVDKETVDYYTKGKESFDQWEKAYEQSVQALLK